MGQVTPKNLQFYIEELVKPFSRTSYLISPSWEKRYITVNKGVPDSSIRSNLDQGDISDLVIENKGYLSDELIEAHLNKKIVIGQSIAKKKGEEFTSWLVVDADQPEQAGAVLRLFVEEITGNDPTIATTSWTPGHHYFAWDLNKTVPMKVLETIRYNVHNATGIRVEVYPMGRGFRGFLGERSYLVDPHNLQPLPFANEVNVTLDYLRDLKEGGAWTVTDTKELREHLSLMEQQNRVLHRRKRSKIFAVSQELAQWESIGLQESRSRNYAHVRLLAKWIRDSHGKMSEDELVLKSKQWHFTHTNGYSRDVGKGNWRSIEREARSTYRRLMSTFNPRKQGGDPLSLEDMRIVYGAVQSLNVEKQYKRRKKVFRLACEIYRLAKTMQSNKVRIPHTLLDRWGYFRKQGRFDAFQVLLNSGLIAPVVGRSYFARATEYTVSYFKVSPSIQSLKSIAKNHGEGISLNIEGGEGEGGENGLVSKDLESKINSEGVSHSNFT